jgi:ferredoxin
MSYIPTIDANACAAHGDCVDVAPQVFALEETAVVIGAGPDDLIVEAAEICPSIAITVVDSETGAQVYP